MSKARDLANASTALNAVTPTELGYLDGVTSSIQTQINTKDSLPSRSGQSGKYLTNNGTDASWGTVSQYSLPSQSGNSGKFLTTDGTSESWGTPGALNPLAIQYLVIGGGGGGSGANAADNGMGGGGAGGYRCSVVGEYSGGYSPAESPYIIATGTNYTVTVGAGGAGSTASTKRATKGSDSVFGNIISYGGGAAVTENGTGQGYMTWGAGGSGGGAGGGNAGVGLYQGGFNNAVTQGCPGGLGDTTNNSGSGGGGGGGAGRPGSNTASAASKVGAAGGDGISSSITGTAVTRAGGGGGCGNTGTGAGGAGGGGSNGSAGTANTGSGGGSTFGTGSTGGAGGSGVVILKYLSNLTITVSGGLTSSTSTVGSYSVTSITAGTGTVSWA